MITLATLEEASEQEVFTQVVCHLRRQGRRCVNEEGDCVYRNAQGLACAAGCLIGDDEHESNMEGWLWNHLISYNIVTDKHDELIDSLQTLHDDMKVETWEEGFQTIADDYGLTLPEPITKEGV